MEKGVKGEREGEDGKETKRNGQNEYMTKRCAHTTAHIHTCTVQHRDIHCSLVICRWFVVSTQFHSLLHQIMPFILQPLPDPHLPCVETLAIMAVDRLR